MEEKATNTDKPQKVNQTNNESKIRGSKKEAQRK
jgi:hypothetical protein